MELSVKDVKALLRRRGALVAALTALAIMLARAIGIVLAAIIGGYGVGIQFDPASTALGLLPTVVPFGFGVFVCLWVILPIAAELEMRFVVTRGLAAAGVGTLLMLVTILIVSIAEYVGRSGYFGGLEDVDMDGVFRRIELGFQVALTDFLVAAPVVILFTIFQWQWLKNHPPKFEVAGILDV